MYRYLASEGKRMWILSFMGETRINHCVQALHTSCLTPEEHFAYFQLENFCFFVFFLLRGKECYN